VAQSVTGRRPDEGLGGPFDVDLSSAYPARIFNYLLGGTENFAADREAAHHLYGGLPGGVDTARTIARATHGFMLDAVRYLAADAGVRQFLSFSSVVRVLDDAHDVAQRIAPDARVTYVVNDPVVLAHAHELKASSPAGGTSFIPSDLRDLPALMQQVAATLDLTEPIAVILQGVLHYISGKADPYWFVAQLLEPVAAGSYLVVSHAGSDIGEAQMVEAANRQWQLTKAMRWPIVPRSHDEVTRFFDGLELVDPGVVALDRWHPPSAPARSSGRPLPWYAAVGRKLS
jgi:S-adenosyl methyltransferase